MKERVWKLNVEMNKYELSKEKIIIHNQSRAARIIKKRDLAQSET